MSILAGITRAPFPGGPDRRAMIDHGLPPAQGGVDTGETVIYQLDELDTIFTTSLVVTF